MNFRSSTFLFTLFTYLFSLLHNRVEKISKNQMPCCLTLCPAFACNFFFTSWPLAGLFNVRFFITTLQSLWAKKEKLPLNNSSPILCAHFLFSHSAPIQGAPFFQHLGILKSHCALSSKKLSLLHRERQKCQRFIL